MENGDSEIVSLIFKPWQNPYLSISKILKTLVIPYVPRLVHVTNGNWLRFKSRPP